MSLTLPIDALRNIQLSFRVGVPDGVFTFDMVPSVDNMGVDVAALCSTTGMQLHLSAVADSCGVTLTLFASEPNVDHKDLESADCVLVNSPQSQSSREVVPCKTEADAVDYLDYSRLKDTSDLLTMGYLTPEDLLAIDTSVNVPYADTRLNPRLFETLAAYDAQTPNLQPIYNGGSFEADAYSDYTSSSSSDHDIFSDFIGSPRTDASTPSTSSESFVAHSPLPRHRGPRSKLCCPKPSCARHFASKATLAKHMVTHEPKSPKEFMCTLGCAMRFSRKHDRLRHEVTQHGRICEWACRVCLGFFSSEATLKKHKCKTAGSARWINKA
ncbi:hypothetical protein MSAN_02012900 [Mycena sanguinolenta]|uniref:C2H2-type domain-containing protein n=1 Tax=Mycena sanguinolenta TaxID=230812 RepID=A0A8H7CLY5_9AGAR|nr:hypothetical protein MSAN_02012900 [Mycena sanguinolenta]